MDAQHYKINQILMSWIGQWPEQSTFKRFLLSVHLLVTVFSQVCLQVLNLVAVWQDWNLVMEISVIIIIHILCLVKYLNYLFNDRKFKSLFNEMKNSWRLATFDDQIQILTIYTNKGKTMVQMYTVVIYGAVIVVLTLPVITASFTSANQTQVRGLVFNVEAVLDTEKYYYYILLHSYYTSIFMITIAIAVDSMLITYVQHACGLFQAIGYQLKNVERSGDLDINIYPLRENDEHYRTIIDSIVKHKEVLQFVELLASSHSISLLILTILNVASITFCAMQVIIKRDQPIEMFRFFSTSVSLAIHFFFLSLPGQKLIDYSSNMHESIYAANWYAISLRARRLLNLMLMRCKVPCKMTAGKMRVMSFQSFSGVMQASMSYFTVLSSAQ